MIEPIKHAISLLKDKKNLNEDLATRIFQIMMNGGATPAQMAALLMGIVIKGETADEITAGAIAMRAKAKKFSSIAGAIDTCGTGGDNRGTYNISTATAFVLAACDIPTIKHGNRSVTSKSGSADVLSMLGVKIDAQTEVMEECLKQCNMAFLFAPKYHTATRHVAPVRQELGIRTIFNILGPLTNPACPDFQLVGVYNKELAKLMTESLKSLGTKAAWVVCGSDGLDELTISGTSHVVSLSNGEIEEFEVSPADAGLNVSPPDSIKGGSPEQNANALVEAISGLESPHRDSIVYNAAAGLVISGKAVSLKEAALIAAEAIDSGKAHSVLKKLVDISNTPMK
ncbi:MAG: anthranilate phosphoribosyltransferase [Rickettsiales bacterium]